MLAAERKSARLHAALAEQAELHVELVLVRQPELVQAPLSLSFLAEAFKKHVSKANDPSPTRLVFYMLLNCSSPSVIFPRGKCMP